MTSLSESFALARPLDLEPTPPLGARGLGSRLVLVFNISSQGKKRWSNRTCTQSS